MKKIAMKRTAPPLPPLPVIQSVSTSEPLPPPPPKVVEPETPKEEAPLPAMPPQMNNPVGPPPEPDKHPETFDDCIALAAMVSRNRMQLAYGTHWAQMAQAFALKDIADSLHELNGFLGAFDNDDEKDEDGEPELPTRLSDQVAEGIMAAVNAVKEDFSDGQLAALAELAAGGKKV